MKMDCILIFLGSLVGKSLRRQEIGLIFEVRLFPKQLFFPSYLPYAFKCGNGL